MEEPIQPIERATALADAKRRRTNIILALVAAATVLVPYLFWRATWFGRPLTDEEMEDYLSDASKPRHIQHALVQIGERLGRGDASVQRWYPKVLSQSETTVPELRITLAWVLGTDNKSDEFHSTLRKLLGDPEPMVRRNAALSLVRFGDASGRKELLGILAPLSITAPASGVIHYRIKDGVSVAWNAVVAQVQRSAEDSVDIHSPIPGTLAHRIIDEGSRAKQGDEVLVMAPEEASAWEVLRALYLIGQPEDIGAVERFASTEGADISDKTRNQATQTIAEIKRRADSGQHTVTN